LYAHLYTDANRSGALSQNADAKPQLGLPHNLKREV
jgi:hypothetical protein